MVNWPDHSTPDEETGYNTLEFILSSINEYKLNFPLSPILTHCSAGTGRTGALIAIYNIIRSLSIVKFINQSLDNKQNRIKPFFSVFNIVRKLREQRMTMVSSYVQYKFIYEFAFEWIRRNMEGYTDDKKEM
jgi:protein tyrosine phosphatase